MAKNKKDAGSSGSSKKSTEKSKNNPPLLQNRENAVTGWIDRDMNGDYFIRLNLPIGLGNIPIFLNDSQYQNIQEEFNQLVKKHVDSQ